MITRTRFFASVTTIMGLAMVIVSGETDARSDNVLTFRLGLNVPTICRIEVRGSLPATPDDAATAEEFCNAPAGYRVFAFHPAVGAGDPLWFDYGGQRVRASVTGMTTLAEEPTAAHRFRTFAVVYPREGQLALPNITLQIVPR